jgi:quercetin dioxygenase-like cupin family protein
MVITGSVSFRVADEERELGPGATWRIPSDVPHEVKAGPEGAVVIDVFSPPRQEDWRGLEREEPRTPLWP